MVTTYLDANRNVSLVTYLDTDRRVQSNLITYLDTKRNVNLATYLDADRRVIADKTPIAFIVNVDTTRAITSDIAVKVDTLRKGYDVCNIGADTKRSTQGIFSVNADTNRLKINDVTIPVIFNVDAKRTLCATVISNIDTQKYTYATTSFNVDTKRVNYSDVAIKADAKRTSYANTKVNADTMRRKSKLISVSISTDTSRKLCRKINCKADVTRALALAVVLDPNLKKADIGIKSIKIQTGVQSLSDRFTIESVGKSFGGVDNFKGEVAGFKFAFEKATTGKTNGFIGKAYSVTGRPDLGNMLDRNVLMMKGAMFYNGGYVISVTAKQICAELGIEANITDFHPLGIGTLNEKTLTFTIDEKSVKSLLDKLFGWSSEFADRQIYYFNRNGKITVQEVGKYTTVYNLDDDTKYKVESMTGTEQKIKKFLDYSYSTKPKKPTTSGTLSLVPNANNVPFSGTTTFGQSSLTYSSGLLTHEVTVDADTTYLYEPANSFAFNSNKNVLKSKTTLNGDGKRSTTTYEYDIAKHGVYASSDIDVSLVSEHTISETKNSSGAWEIDSEHKTYHVPLGNGFFGQRVEEIDSGSHTTVATSISRGSPGGLASLYTVQQANGWTMAKDDPTLPKIDDFTGELVTGYNMPVADIPVLNSLIQKINWMNGKTEEIINLSVINIHGTDLVDAVNGAIIYEGNLYYPQSTNATINDRGTRQQISAVRWY